MTDSCADDYEVEMSHLSNHKAHLATLVRRTHLKAILEKKGCGRDGAFDNKYLFGCNCGKGWL